MSRKFIVSKGRMQGMSRIASMSSITTLMNKMLKKYYSKRPMIRNKKHIPSGIKKKILKKITWQIISVEKHFKNLQKIVNRTK